MPSATQDGGASESLLEAQPAPACGPLAGVNVLELGGIGPGPFAAMMLSDLGAHVTRVDRPGEDALLQATHSILLRGRERITLDLKDPQARGEVLQRVEHSQVVIEGFRPGVLEHLGLGPDVLLATRPDLIVGRMTGWGQEGPLAGRAGHDLTYLALSGALEPICGVDGSPVPPLNMLGDFGGGGMLLAVGVLAALWRATATGEGQVVDAAIVDGAGLMTAMHHAMLASGAWGAPRGGNLFDGGCPFYTVYRTRDDRFVAVAPLEPQFLAQLLAGLGVSNDPIAASITDPATWPQAKSRLAAIFATRDRDDWAELFADTDACLAPVLSPAEAALHPHALARGSFVPEGDGVQPAPAPRFSLTPLQTQATAPKT